MRLSIAILSLIVTSSAALAQPPKSLDPRLEIVQFAASPDIVHPIAVDFDSKGRLLVVESHTHFRPKGYKGPEADRIRIIEDTDGDGKADKFTTFYEGTKATMDLAVHPDGSVYVATRNEILRLRDTKGTGKADEVTRLVFLETKGDYPHNGLSGLCFDFKGDLYFGLGENLGESYVLKGADGTTLKGGGEGGNIYWCTADGKNLRRVATGFWNPFGICRDVYGRIFAVDNDPDSRPPCRLVHVVEGGDYGYQFRYGRSGRHPFQAWNGELPGTLPYVAGVGEAPCEVLAYESDGLPKDYLGTLLVTSWGDHRLECYPLEAKGASFTAKKKVVIQGGANFRPVGLAVAPDGSLFMSDWVRRDYNLHGQGAIWQVRAKPGVVAKREKSKEFKLQLPLRRFDNEKLTANWSGLFALSGGLRSEDPRIRAYSVQKIIAEGSPHFVKLDEIAKSDAPPEVRLVAVRLMGQSGEKFGDLAANFLSGSMIAPKKGTNSSVGFKSRAEAAAILECPPKLTIPNGMAGIGTVIPAVHAFESEDPFLRHAALRFFLNIDDAVVGAPIDPTSPRLIPEPAKFTDAQRIGFFLVLRTKNTDRCKAFIPKLLESPIDDIRFLTAKWISDEVIKEAREPLEKAMKDPNLNSRLYLAYATALARINGEPVNESRLADMFLRRAKDEKASPAARVAALRMVPTNKLTTDQLVKWTTDPSPEIRLEAVRALNEQSGTKRNEALHAIVIGEKADFELRREALVGLADQGHEVHWRLLIGNFGADAWRGLVNVPFFGPDKVALEKDAVNAVANDAASKQFVDRVLGRPLRSKEDQAADVDAWLKRLEGKGDPDAGRRVFFHPRVGTCAKCHRVDGRGKDIGPDLSTIGQRDKRFILESILFPSREVAPQFQTWQVETPDGKVRTGLLVGTDVDQATYVDEKGQRFTVPAHESDARAVPASIMPDGLSAQLTDQELRDLLAYLVSRK